MPGELWPEYVEERFHPYLDKLAIEGRLYSRMMQSLADMKLPAEVLARFDPSGARAGGKWRGVWDADVRIAEMDREGVAAEFVFHGDHHSCDIFYSVFNGTYTYAAVDAGVRAYGRWASDTFGPHADRLLMISPVGPCLDIDAAMAHVHWLKEHKFIGQYLPGYVAYPGQPPLFDAYWDPLWACYQDLDMTLVIHGGYGAPQGQGFGDIIAAEARVNAAGGSDADLAIELSQKVLRGDFFNDLRCRQAMWQLMLGGVFDRFPGLRVMVTEVRADWVPSLLRLLDRTWEENRDWLPAKRRPSEYWEGNWMAGVSFMRRSEVAMRHEIGVERLSFGRDFPHLESTWPNTPEYLQGLFTGVPEGEARAILGENLVDYLGLDRAHLAAIAERVGPSLEAVTGSGPELAEDLLQHLDTRCGYRTGAEGERRVGEMEAMLKPDLPRIRRAAAGLALA
jgi:predicted TIM-barrel fold metal-dependent hydrolase